MTEAEWEGKASDIYRLAKSLHGMASERKRRLLAAACCRRNWHLLDDEVSRPGLEVIERYADNLATTCELAETHRAARANGKEFEKLCQWRRNTRGPSSQADALHRESLQAYLIAYASQQEDYLWWVVNHTTECRLWEAVEFQRAYEQQTHAKLIEERKRCSASDSVVLVGLLRDIFGNPFRPVAFDASWRTSTVVAIAQGMYDPRDFSAMPILADALQDAGCDNDDILNHCRDANGVHVRGCWVVDLVLGKS